MVVSILTASESVKDKTGRRAVREVLTDAPSVGYDAANFRTRMENTMLSSRPWCRRGVDLAAVAAISMGAYAASLHGYFLSDDFNVV